MSEIPEDIIKMVEDMPLHGDGYPDAEDKMTIARAIFAERERCNVEHASRIEAISADLRRQCDTLIDNWTSDLGATFETKAAGAASWIINDAVSSIEVELVKLGRKGGAA